jgi:hypothetical protein
MPQLARRVVAPRPGEKAPFAPEVRFSLFSAAMPRPARRRRPALALGAAALALGGLACDRAPSKGDAPGAPALGPDASASAPARPDPSAAAPGASAPPAAAPGAPAEQPVVDGVRAWLDLTARKGPCAVRARELDPNLLFGSVALAAHRRELAMASVLSTRVRGEGLVAFGAYDTLARSVAKSHGLGKAVAAVPHIFYGNDDWTVTWFDRGGLVYARTTHARQVAEPTRVGAIAAADAEHTAVIRTAAGPLLGVAPVRPEARTELGLFLFDSPDPDAPAARALGATRNASGPRHPALLELGGGYLVAWEDADAPGAPLLATRFDPTGRESGARKRVSSPEARAPARPALAAAGPAGALAAWVETFRDAPTVFVRALDPTGAPLGPPFRVGEGSAPALYPVDGGAALAFVSAAGLAAENVVLVGVTPSGKPAAEGFVVSEATAKRALARAAAPALAAGGDGRLGVAFAYAPDTRVAMKTLAARCLFASAAAAP